MKFDFGQKGIKKLVFSVFAVIAVIVVITTTVFGAQTTRKGKVNSNVSPDTLRVRSEANTSSSSNVLFSLAEGDEFIILGEIEGTEAKPGNKIWYYIEYNGLKGYAYSHYITIMPDVVIPEDADFETYLTQQGFPESYKQPLRELHAKYPNWVFRAQHINFDFDYAVGQEKPLSLVHTTSISSWKSTEGDAYDWASNTWRGFDGASWVRASEGIIRHYMDPRNFLGENSVFQFLEQSFDANIQNVDGIKRIIANSFMDETKGHSYLYEKDGTLVDYANTIYNAGREYGANPYVLAAMIVIEQGTNGSTLISGTYDGDGGAYYGYYNYFNVGAYAQGNMNAIQRGLWYARGGNETNPNNMTNLRPWNTRVRAIQGGAYYYATGYINVGQNTLYLKKFNVQGSNPFTHQYMTNIQGAASEASELAQGYSEELRSVALSFSIPVYKNMPETAVVRPTGDGSPNMKLSSLSVQGFELTPNFDPDGLEYMLVVPPSVNSVTVDTIVMESSAVVSGIGVLPLTEDRHVFEIKVTAGNGSTRVYKLTVAKENSDSFGKVTFTNNYTVNNSIVIGIAPNMKIGDFQSRFLSQGSITVTNSAGVAKDANSILATGDVIKVRSTNNMPYGEYTASVKGDVNGDGKVNISDLVKVRNKILGTDPLTTVGISAADIDGAGAINISDLVKIRNHILGTGIIS